MESTLAISEEVVTVRSDYGFTTGNDYVELPLDFKEHSDSIEAVINWFKQFIATPIICTAGVIGNIISAIVVVKSGLRKPSNIFLFGLAIADLMSLCNVFDISGYIYFGRGSCLLSCYTPPFTFLPAYVIWMLYVLMFVFTSFGMRMTTTVAVIITVERLVAVYIPLKSSRIVTSTRAWFVLACAGLFWMPWVVFQGFWFKLKYAFFERINTYVWFHSVTDIYTGKNFNWTFFHDVFVTHLTHTIPLILVTTGSLAIGIKVSINNRKRQKIISRINTKRSSSRTTKTLLMVCVFFSVSRFCYVIRNLLLFDSDNPVSMALALIRDRILNLNSACNFFIYIVCNPRFRKILRNLFLTHRFTGKSNA